MNNTPPEEIIAVMIQNLKMGLESYEEFKEQKELVDEIGYKLRVLENEILRIRLRKEQAMTERSLARKIKDAIQMGDEEMLEVVRRVSSE